jgi:hypothetical protein
MPLFRCLNQKCATGDFEAAGAVCPGCKIDGNVPELKPMIQRLVTVHFDPPHPVLSGRGLNVLACNPKRAVFGLAASGDHTAVNCPKCKATPAYKNSYPDFGDGDGAEASVVVDAAAMGGCGQ